MSRCKRCRREVPFESVSSCSAEGTPLACTLGANRKCTSNRVYRCPNISILGSALLLRASRRKFALIGPMDVAAEARKQRTPSQARASIPTALPARRPRHMQRFRSPPGVTTDVGAVRPSARARYAGRRSMTTLN